MSFSLSGSWFKNQAVKILWHVHERHGYTEAPWEFYWSTWHRWVALLGGLGVPLFTSGTLRLFFSCHSPQHYISDLAYFILFTSGNFSDAAEEFIFSQIWTRDLLFVWPACKPPIHCVWYYSITVMYFDWSIKVSAASQDKKKMIIKQSVGKHLRPALKNRTAPLLLWTFSS